MTAEGARLKEIAAALLTRGDMVAAEIEMEHSATTLTLTVTVCGGIDLTELQLALEQVRDVAQARALCERYGIPPEALVHYITGRG